eukprot:TRINITY_DN202_c0_g2_i2.p1 TRINITY_DN202_c0_g2~~TRINITY_DN202_c0_g2_i2.p1  ORF type:complete len:439 (+),score=183.58 TRINITY_DN202_c0_g2_i2:162-1478(+)
MKNNLQILKFNLNKRQIELKFLREIQTIEIKKKKLVVLGCGWAGFRVAKEVNKKDYEVTVVSPRNHFLFTPLLPSTTVGTLEFRCIIEPVRNIKGITFFQASAKKLNYEESVIECESVFGQEDRFKLNYDELVIAVGAHNQTFGIPGVLENAFFLKELEHARNIRMRILYLLEKASEPTTTDEEKAKMLHFIVVGAGPTGTEFVGELVDFLNEDVKKTFPSAHPFIKVTLVEASKKVLGSFDDTLSKYAFSQLQKNNVNLETSARVKCLRPNELELADGRILNFGLCVWSTGVAPRPFVQSIDLKKTESAGRLIVDEYLKVLNTNNIYAIGDCGTTQQNLPATAQVAHQQAKYLGKLLNDKAKNKKLAPFFYNNRGMLAYLGGYKAVTDLPQAKWTGLSSWIFWRSAYLTNLVSISNKVLVPMHWFKSFVFGRDTSRF